MADEPQQTQPDEGKRAIFRIPGTALLSVIILLFCVTPAAFALPGLQVLYLIPIGVTVVVIRLRTTATRNGLTVRTVFGTRELPWSALKGLAITPKSKVQAVLTDGSKVALPAVRTRHIPVLSLVSEGLIADPSGVLDAADDSGSDHDSEPKPEPEPAEKKA
ncbi:PH domain-containing protein [Saccharomonospora sp. NPDC046836]|uniref:PH domain-containing protein n=1 Tax=Saccharomonospora sp. NPDC046836 TaxID=3156921 RepID=UPI0033C207D1